MLGVVMSAAAVNVRLSPVMTDWLCGLVVIVGASAGWKMSWPKGVSPDAAANPRWPRPSVPPLVSPNRSS